jgi:hypothetical protein
VIVRKLGGLAEVASNAGLVAVEDDDRFGDAIRRLQAMKPESLRAQIDEARRLALAHYHPQRFERDVGQLFGTW